jgi:hypothetical protein
MNLQSHANTATPAAVAVALLCPCSLLGPSVLVEIRPRFGPAAHAAALNRKAERTFAGWMLWQSSLITVVPMQATACV